MDGNQRPFVVKSWSALPWFIRVWTVLSTTISRQQQLRLKDQDTWTEVLECECFVAVHNFRLEQCHESTTRWCGLEAGGGSFLQGLSIQFMIWHEHSECVLKCFDWAYYNPARMDFRPTSRESQFGGGMGGLVSLSESPSATALLILKNNHETPRARRPDTRRLPHARHVHPNYRCS
jgi:hypothetical protein